MFTWPATYIYDVLPSKGKVSKIWTLILVIIARSGQVAINEMTKADGFVIGIQGVHVVGISRPHEPAFRIFPEPVNVEYPWKIPNLLAHLNVVPEIVGQYSNKLQFLPEIYGYRHGQDNNAYYNERVVINRR